MAAITLDQVLTEAAALSADEKVMLEDLLRKRRVEAWRIETTAAAKRAVKDFRAGKLKSQSPDDVIARLRAGLDADAG
jgi:aspartate 1-decarboxylase